MVFKYILLGLTTCDSYKPDLTVLENKKELHIMVMDSGVSFKYPNINKYLTSIDKTQIDTFGHGTHVTSTILKDACSKVKITVCKHWDKSWAKDKIYQEMYNCYKKAVALKVDIFHYSGGGKGWDIKEYSLITQMRENKTLFVVATGNDSLNIDMEPYYPASYNISNIIPISNLAPSGKPNITSNYGKNVIWEIGTNVEALGLNGLEKMTGTSMAAANYTNLLVRRFCKGLR